MAETENVIKGLENLSEWLFQQYRVVYDGDAPNYYDAYKTVDDALALLKEQEARVMTLDEVKSFNWDYCYLEKERLPGKEYRAVCGDYALTCITWPCIASMRIQHGDDSYGKKWRCWSAKPTDEQRQEIKWE